MALIQCPECGQNVSDKAAQCIHCGSPLQKPKNEISVRLQASPMADSLQIYTYTISNDNTGEVFGMFKGSQIWTAEIDVPMKIRFHLNKVNFGLTNDAVLDYIPNGIVKYDMEIVRGLFKMSLVLNKVDSFVSAHK